MKITPILVLTLCSTTLLVHPSPEQKNTKPSRSIISSIRNGMHRTRKTVAALSEFAIGGGGLMYSALMLRGKSTRGELQSGNKAIVALYSAGTIIGVSLLLDGIEELNNQVDLTERFKNLLKKLNSLIASRETKRKKSRVM